MSISKDFMLFSSLRVYKDVIYEYYDKGIKLIMEDSIHKVHKRNKYVNETEWNDKKLIITRPSMEGNLRMSFFLTLSWL